MNEEEALACEAPLASSEDGMTSRSLQSSEVLASSDVLSSHQASALPQPDAISSALPRLKDFEKFPSGLTEEQRLELSKRLLSVSTRHGVIASVHLQKLPEFDARHVFSWIFDSHHVVMGDMNCRWQHMIGGATLDNGKGPPGKRVTDKSEGWFKSETHAAVNRPGGTYLSGSTQGWKGASTSPAFDMVVVRRPFSVSLPKQPGKRFMRAKIPRSLMHCHLWPSDGWPSDHTSVVARVDSNCVKGALTVATWNVADPWYFSQFWPDAASGFELKYEHNRLIAVEKHVVELLDVADVVGLQEVPSHLVGRLASNGAERSFEVQWIATPSSKDEIIHSVSVAKHGRCSDGAPKDLPLCAHNMLFARRAIVLSSARPS